MINFKLLYLNNEWGTQGYKQKFKGLQIRQGRSETGLNTKGLQGDNLDYQVLTNERNTRMERNKCSVGHKLDKDI